MDNRKKMLVADAAILLVALIWGATNVIIRDALSGITPFWFCALRFAVACATVMAVFGKRAFAMPRSAKISGMLTGTVFICAYLVGAAALLYTTAGNESFIISASVVFVPLAVWIISHVFPGWHVVISAAAVITGAGVLAAGETGAVNIGDLMSFASMLFVTAHIMLVQRFARDADPCGLACWQAFGGMILAAACALIFEPFPAHLGTKAIIAVIYAGTIGFALTLVLQTAAQKYTTPSHTALLLATSAIFGSVIGIIFLGEPMTPRIFAASALILGGVVFAEIYPMVIAARDKERREK